MNSSKQVCRFCLKEIHDEYFEEIGETAKYILAELYITVNLDISEEPLMCKDCSESIHKAFNFKKAYIQTEDCLSTFFDLQHDRDIDLREIYLKMNQKENIGDGDVCRFCMNLVSNKCSRPLSIIIGNTSAIKDLLDEYFPEFDLCSVKDPIVCDVCLKNLQDHINFITVCINLEDNIQKYTQIKGLDRDGKVNLKSVHQFLPKSSIKSEVGLMDKDGNDVKQKFYEDLQFDIKTEEISIKDDKYESNAATGFVLKQEYGNFLHVSEAEYLYSSSIITHSIYTRDPLSHDIPSKTALYTCENENCSYTSKRKNDLVRHSLIHKNPSELTMHRCEREGCVFVTKHKRSLKNHILTHQNASEVKLYRCEREGCSFETKYKRSIKNHIMVHKNISEVNTYKCENENCSFKTKWEQYLKIHKLTHTKVSVYMCEHEGCPYKTKMKYRLVQHSEIHKNPFNMYLCENESCSYKTKRKKSLRAHLLIHKDPSEIRMYKCENENCSFKTKRKPDLDRHSLTHKNPSELTMYKCGYEDCLFETKHKRSLQTHMVTHPNGSKVKVHNCKKEDCSFKTKNKKLLQIHMLIHKNVQV